MNLDNLNLKYLNIIDIQTDIFDNPNLKDLSKY